MRLFASRLLPNNLWVRLAFVPVLAFIALATDRQYLCDFWHHLARGRYIVEERRLLDHDIFTYTVAGQPFQDVNWLSQVIYFHLFDAGGLHLVYQVNAAIVALTLFLVVCIAWQKSGSAAVGAGIGLFVFLGQWEVLTIRPQTFSLLLFVLCYWILDASERRRWLLGLLPFLMALWVNLHGAFPAGLLLMGCFLVAAMIRAFKSRDRQAMSHCGVLALCLGLGLLATLANPYGWGIYSYVSQTSGRAAARRIDEWVPPNFQQMSGLAFFVSLIVVAGVFLWAWRRNRQLPSARDIILLAVFLPLAAGSVRMVAWWFLLIAPMLAVRIGTLLPRDKLDSAEDRQPTWNAGFAWGVLVLAVVFCLPSLQEYNMLLQFTRSGQRTEDRLESFRDKLPAKNEPVRIFSRLEWGEYLGWSFAPRALVFMDGRIEIYPDDVWEHFTSITCGKSDWEELLDRYYVDGLLLDIDYHGKMGLLTKVRESAIWRPAGQAGQAQLFVRTSPDQIFKIRAMK